MNTRVFPGQGGLSHDNPNRNDESLPIRKEKRSRLGIYSGRERQASFFGRRVCFLALLSRLPYYMFHVGIAVFSDW